MGLKMADSVRYAYIPAPATCCIDVVFYHGCTCSCLVLLE